MGNQVTQPAATPSGQTQTPTLTLSEPNLFNADPSDLTFDFDENSGQFQMIFKQAQGQEQIKDDTTLQSQQQQTQQQTQPAAPAFNKEEYDNRFSTIENALIRIGQHLETMGQSNGQQQTQQTQQTTLDVNSDDFTSNLVNIINQAIEKKLESVVTPINKNMDVVTERMLLTDLAVKHGKEFTDLLPAMTEYKKSDPKADWEKMFLAMSKIPRANGTQQQDSTIRTTNGSNGNGQPQVDLLKKAEQMSTVRDGMSPNVISDTPKGKMTVASALEQSIKELFG